MSIQTVTNQITSVDREIHTIERQIHTIDSNIFRKQRELTTILDRITREKDAKKAVNHLKDQTRKSEDIGKLQKDKGSKSKTLADKVKKRNELLARLHKEQQWERDHAKREQKELLSIQQDITREMENQRRFSLDFVDTIIQAKGTRSYDVFISHAFEDKKDFVRPFASSLREKGLQVWYDEFELQVGDSLRRSIDKGLAASRFGVVILSVAFFSKEWPQQELDGLFARQMNGENIILPIWHKITKDEVTRYSPLIAGMFALTTASFTIEEISDRIASKVLQHH